MHPQMWKLRASTRTAMQPPRTICHAPVSHDPPCLRLGFSFVQPPDPSGPRLSFPSAVKQPIRENAPTNLEAAAMAPDLAMAFMIWKPHNLHCRFGKHDLGTAITTTIPQMSRPPTTRTPRFGNAPFGTIALDLAIVCMIFVADLESARSTTLIWKVPCQTIPAQIPQIVHPPSLKRSQLPSCSNLPTTTEILRSHSSSSSCVSGTRLLDILSSLLRISLRGETEDTFVVDLAVGLSTGQIKTGAHPADQSVLPNTTRQLKCHNNNYECQVLDEVQQQHMLV
ncbi:hypothetical protein ZEAMMB73_Zm00001d017981 [Zea mays]|uniref:phosphopyruvate hydratase n=1 Tax=Zea mays TaxID=4577 RepID=A0A1D6HJR6_MAIZE|nr:hypothetical protein ZEAMMB73_Zm00001d017981 [Zea mays]